MPYALKKQLGDDFDWPTELYDLSNPSIPSYDYPVYQEPDIIMTKTPDYSWTTPSATVQEPAGKSWWDQITGALVPISQAASNIIRATSGQPSLPTAPAGYTRDYAGNLVPIGQIGATQSGFNFQSILLPAALGIGAVLLLRGSGGSRRRR